MTKKWYNFFVVSEAGTAADGEPMPPSGADSDAPRAGDALDGVPAPEFEGASGAASLAAIYEAARIPEPPHGYTILKVAEMLRSEHIRELPPEVRRKSVLVALDAAKVPVEDIVEDAVLRDRALDTYERVLERNLEALGTATAAENGRLQAEIEQRLKELRERVAENERSVEQARRELAAWRAAKQAEEARIAEAVGHFVAENPVSISSAGTTGG